MHNQPLIDLLQDFKAGKKDLDQVLDELKKLPYEDLDFAKIDHHRALRNGFPEVIFCQGKTVSQVVQIFSSLAGRNGNILATRASRKIYDAIANLYPGARYNELARTISLIREEPSATLGEILVLTAGTADMPVAEEAVETALAMGHGVERVYDVGVAGIHRLFAHYRKLERATVIIVVAGMEGALAGVVAGLVDVPVVAVPTSVGYGASFNGLAALLGMLNSCAKGIGVVNIDNGFGAAALADVILRSARKIHSINTNRDY